LVVQGLALVFKQAVALPASQFNWISLCSLCIILPNILAQIHFFAPPKRQLIAARICSRGDLSILYAWPGPGLKIKRKEKKSDFFFPPLPFCLSVTEIGGDKTRN